MNLIKTDRSVLKLKLETEHSPSSLVHDNDHDNDLRAQTL